jgi:glyoxylase-like metal-dependent hydrolase (beta-lactamase superfamily II)/ferredoxin
MARLLDRHPANREGDWYVDTRCIDCGACRQLAPAIFGQGRDQSLVVAQPDPAADHGDGDFTAAWRASIACPTQSIGTVSRSARPEGLFPQELSDGVYYCGFNSERSFGAHSYFVCRPEGNLLVDSPRWTRRLAEPIEARGGIDDVLLTHRDDVADAERWADYFGARVWIHAADGDAAPFASHLLAGSEDTEIRPGLTAVPVPGHTKGSVVYLLDKRFLFSGDSLAWQGGKGGAVGDLTAFRHACWYSWSEQTSSLARLASRHRFSWVLPGHGGRHCCDPGDMHRRLVALVDRMGRL